MQEIGVFRSERKMNGNELGSAIGVKLCKTGLSLRLDSDTRSND